MDQFIAAYKRAFERYTDFAGRTSVGGFWRFAAVNFGISAVLWVLGTQVGSVFLILSFAYWVATIVPSLAIGARRLHDTDKSAWFLMLAVFPIVGTIILIVIFIQESVGPNEYGNGPED